MVQGALKEFCKVLCLEGSILHDAAFDARLAKSNYWMQSRVFGGDVYEDLFSYLSPGIVFIHSPLYAKFIKKNYSDIFFVQSIQKYTKLQL